MNYLILAIIFQILFTLWFALTHWVPLSPLNDLSEEAFPNERKTNLILHGFQVGSILGSIFSISWLMWVGSIFWSVSLMGHITSWWLPYFFGWPKAFLENAVSDNAKTYHFLPARKNHPIPDLTHYGIGLFALLATIYSWLAIFQ